MFSFFLFLLRCLIFLFLDLINLDLYRNSQVKPGLSSYENDPKAAAKSLEPLLLKAESVVPINLHPDTPVELGVSIVIFTLSV